MCFFSHLLHQCILPNLRSSCSSALLQDKASHIFGEYRNTMFFFISELLINGFKAVSIFNLPVPPLSRLCNSPLLFSCLSVCLDQFCSLLEVQTFSLTKQCRFAHLATLAFDYLKVNLGLWIGFLKITKLKTAIHSLYFFHIWHTNWNVNRPHSAQTIMGYYMLIWYHSHIF